MYYYGRIYLDGSAMNQLEAPIEDSEAVWESLRAIARTTWRTLDVLGIPYSTETTEVTMGQATEFRVFIDTHAEVA